MANLPVEKQNPNNLNWASHNLVLPTETQEKYRINGITASGLWAILEIPAGSYAFSIDVQGAVTGGVSLWSVSDVANEARANDMGRIDDIGAHDPTTRFPINGEVFVMVRGASIVGTATCYVTFYAKG